MNSNDLTREQFAKIGKPLFSGINYGKLKASATASEAPLLLDGSKTAKTLTRIIHQPEGASDRFLFHESVSIQTGR